MVMNAEQKSGFAAILDNLGVLAFAPGVILLAGYGDPKGKAWTLFYLLVGALACFYTAYCLRKQ